MENVKRLRETTVFVVALSIIILILRAVPVVTDSAVSMKPNELHFGPPESFTPQAPLEHQRPQDQTFLTFPEWFLVFSPAEFAQFIAHETPTRFPFYGHIVQFWQAYGAVTRVISDRYPMNYGYHVMIMVIGVSTTVEYVIKGLYENSVGALTSLLGHHTDEDQFYANYQADYVRFIRDQPWYLFNFTDELKKLYGDVPLIGANPIRKFERRAFLTNELLAKILYGKLIKVATQSAYETPIEKTAVVVSEAGHERLEYLPRYEAFMRAVIPLARKGTAFTEIAGNRGPIVVSVVTPKDQRAKLAANDIILAQPILTQEPLERFVVAVPLKDLSGFLREYSKPPASIEHVFDF